MKIQAMPALRDDFDRISRFRRGFAGILLDDLVQTLGHVEAAAETFGLFFPTLVISVHRSEETAKQRFVTRAHDGKDDESRFERRNGRFRRENLAVASHCDAYAGCVVKTDTECDPD